MGLLAVFILYKYTAYAMTDLYNIHNNQLDNKCLYSLLSHHKCALQIVGYGFPDLIPLWNKAETKGTFLINGASSQFGAWNRSI